VLIGLALFSGKGLEQRLFPSRLFETVFGIDVLRRRRAQITNIVHRIMLISAGVEHPNGVSDNVALVEGRRNGDAVDLAAVLLGPDDLGGPDDAYVGLALLDAVKI
jgi:hypothetical protein